MAFDRAKWFREYRKKRGEEINAQRRARWAADSEKKCKQQSDRRKREGFYVGRWARYSKEYRERNRERLIKKEKDDRDKCKFSVFALYGGICQRCGFSDHRALQIDHIKRANQKCRTPGRSGYEVYFSILKGKRKKEDFQLLCANCNWIKRFENNEHGSYNYRSKDGLSSEVGK